MQSYCRNKQGARFNDNSVKRVLFEPQNITKQYHTQQQLSTLRGPFSALTLQEYLNTPTKKSPQNSVT